MNAKWLQSSIARRLFLSRLGLGVGIAGATLAGSAPAAAQAATDAPWRPARHTQDDWYDKIPGVHRFVFDASTAEGLGLALQFASNFYMVNESGYNLKDSDLAVIIVVRHKGTSMAYNDAMWAKYGKQFSDQSEYTDPKTKLPPTVNVFASNADGAPQQGKMDALIKKGVQFAVCGTSTRGIATRIAKANSVDVDAVIKELTANLVGNSRIVPAGILAVNRAQEHGYTFAHAI